MPCPSALGLLALSAFLLSLSVKAIVVQKAPNIRYLQLMCYPTMSNSSVVLRAPNTLSQSPFPCEQMMYLEAVCTANGTTPIDFEAEKQCLCGGNYFAASTGCADCVTSHGGQDNDEDEWVSIITSLSKVECASATPTEPFSNLRTPTPFSLLSKTDSLHNKTAVSLYYTGGTLPTPGSITGDATGRVTAFKNSPTSGGGAAATTSSTAAAAQRTAAGGLAAMVFGAVMML